MKAVTGINISINDDGKIYISAPSYEDDGFLWALESREIDIDTLRRIASLLGDDVLQGVDKRFDLMVERLNKTIKTHEFRIKMIEEAKIALEKLQIQQPLKEEE